MPIHWGINVIEWIKVVLLGIVEGLTEFLPISSTGHLIVGVALLDFRNSMNGTFEIFIQFGAVLAVLFYYRRDLWHQLVSFRTDPKIRHFWIGIIIAVLPAGTFGYLLRDWIKGVLFSPTIVAISLIVGGLIFLLVERHPTPEDQYTDEQLTSITFRQAFLIGVGQMVALIPGVSRSGASIITGIKVGLSRQAATHFSFYLFIPILGGATLVDLLGSLDTISSRDIAMLAVGAAVSGIVAWLSIDWLLRYVARNSFVVFGYYRILAGIVILALVAAGLSLN
ncbi:MAG: undecaprenyl-diphosphate phosphatase [Anaerolineae bacterium]|nr:undecaprenyl-diphosphate phosphatase [Anaerolineae bacterium]